MITDTQKIYKQGTPGRCFTTSTWDMNERNHENYYAIVAETDEGEIISYLSFLISQNRKDEDDFLWILDMCTKIDYRRRGISMILHYIPIAYAFVNEFTFVGSDTKNVMSRKLMVDKFGFIDLTPECQDNFLRFIIREYDAAVNIVLYLGDIEYSTEEIPHLSEMVYRQLQQCLGKYTNQ